MAKRTKTNLRDDAKLKLIGDKIRECRLSMGLTQEELANKCGEKEWSQISRMERGLVNFTISYLFKIADALEIQPKDLLP